MAAPARQTLVPFRRSPSRLVRFPPVRALVGRSAEVELLCRLVEKGRLVTVLGPPGIGKTSLAVHAAERLQARLPGWFCDLSNQRTEAELAAQVMALFGKAANAPEEVGEWLATLGPALLVLDNFEQLASAAPSVVEWSRAAPELSILVTSRERLAVDGERVLELTPLAVPEPGAVEELATSEAVRLFLERARDAGASPGDNLEAVAEVVRHLDGIPLAIELAAARTRLLSPAELAERLRGGDDMLAIRKRGHARHETLADAIRWSWELLSDEERRALACCSVFAGSFPVRAAERVLETAAIESPAIEVLAALREKSLVYAAGEGRLGLYASIRQFAARTLGGEDRENALDAHASFFRERAARFTRSRLLLERFRETSAHGAMWRDADNLVGALDHSAETEARVDLAGALIFLGVSTAATEADLAEALDDAATPPSTRAVARLALHQALVARGRFDEASGHATRVIEDASMPASIRAAAWVRLGISQRVEGKTGEAMRSHERAAALIGDAPSSLRAIDVACMGRLMCDIRDVDAARRLNDEATALAQALGEPWLAALGPANLAQLEQELGAFDRAEALLEPAIARFRDASEPLYEMLYAAVCGGLYFEQGRYELARGWYRATEGPTEGLLPATARVMLHGGWAALEAETGDASAARHHLELARGSLLRSPGKLAGLVQETFDAAVAISLGHAGDAVVQRACELASGVGEDASVLAANVDARFALRILGRALRSSTASAVLRIERDGEAFSVQGGPKVDLSRRAALRRILIALAEAHREAPMDADALFARGWPGQRIRPDSASTRVRVAIATLRKMGLREVLLTREEGYVFDPNVVVEREG